MSAMRSLNLDVEPDPPHPQLAHAPIVEAVIHWQTPQKAALVQDEFRDQIVARLPEYSDRTPIRQVQFETKFDENDSPSTTQDDTWAGWRTASSDGRDVAQFNVDGFALSRLKPYAGWRAFVQEALKLWKVYVELVQPESIARLGVRYINRITPVTIGDTESLLSRPPVRLKSLGLPVREFLYQSVHEVPGYDYRLRILDTIQPEMMSRQTGYALLLDIDASMTRSLATDDPELTRHLERLHRLKNYAFFNLVTPAGIKRFNEEPL